MKCDSCGTIQDTDSKYCKECGSQLTPKKMDIEMEETEPESVVSPRLLEIWRLYEGGNLTEAALIAEELLQAKDFSPSLHSVTALVYEKKAAKEEEAGQFSLSKSSYKRAIEQYEAVLKDNPGSAADVAKLNLLKSKLGFSGTIDHKKSIDSLKVFISTKQGRLFATTAVFLILAIILLLAFSGKKPQSEPDRIAVTNNRIPVPRSNQQQPSEQPPVKIMTFPVQPQNTQVQPQNRQQPIAPQDSENNFELRPPVPARAPDVKPLNLPNLNIVQTNSKPAQTNAAPTQEQNAQPNGKSEAQALIGDADSMLSRAFTFKSQNDNDKALAAAQKAIEIYKEAMDKGASADRCSSGIDNANRIIEIIGNQ